MKIITVTLNPCQDVNYKLETQFLAGGLNRVPMPDTTFSGKGVNVSRELLRLRAESTVCTLLGGMKGAEMEASLRREGMTLSVVHTGHEIRTNTSIIDGNDAQTQINETGYPVSEAELKEFISLFKMEINCPDKTVVVLSGSIPPGIPSDIYSKFSRIAKNAGAYVILDCDGDALRLGLDGDPDLIKPNQEEFEALAGKTLTGKGEALRIDAARETLEFYRNYHTAVLCTLGEHGSVYAGGEGSYMCQSVKADIKTFKGAGDTFLAVFLYEHIVREKDCGAAMMLAAAKTARVLEGKS